VDQTSPTTSPTDAAQARDGGQPPDAEALAAQSVAQTGFAARGRARRRARFLRKARELAYRDLGGLVFNLHRFGQRNDALVLAKLNTLSHIDVELRTLESALSESQPVTVLREAGITACPRCAAIHSSEDRFCSNCGLPASRHVDLPIAGQPTTSQPTTGQAATGQPAAAGQPTTGQPTTTKPATGQPTSGEPKTAQTSPAQPTSGQATTGQQGPAPAAAPPAGAPSEPTTAAADAPPAAPKATKPAAPPAADQAKSPGEQEQPTEIVRAPRVGR
jgi:hypothetical protein